MAQLYIRGDQANALALTFAREGRLAGKRALRHMRRVSQLVLEQSIRNSPVDFKGPKGEYHNPGHELERSHRLVEQYGDRGRLEATVEVGGMVGEVNVDLYADWIHFGSYNLGKASIAKQAGDPEAKVGPYFLENAVRDHEDDFEPLLDELLGGLME